MNITKKNSPLISVIIPIYKVEQYLCRCIESVRNQDYTNLEILLIDDGSPDKCPEICDKYAKADDRIRVIHKKNGGLSSARNAGLDAATGDLIAFVDSDDWLEPITYSSVVDFLSENDLDIVCFEISRICGDKEIEHYHFYKNKTILSGGDVAREILLDKIGSHVVKGVYKIGCWDNIRFPIGLLYEDIYVTFKIFDKAKKVGFIAEAFYKYWENDQGISLTPNPITPYHLYLGFREHYNYALEKYCDIVDGCLANATMYAISTCFHYYSEKNEILKEPCVEIEQFLNDNKKQIKAYKGFMKSRKVALNAFYFSKPLFKLACRLFHVTGLQKTTHFDMK